MTTCTTSSSWLAPFEPRAVIQRLRRLPARHQRRPHPRALPGDRPTPAGRGQLGRWPVAPNCPPPPPRSSSTLTPTPAGTAALRLVRRGLPPSQAPDARHRLEPLPAPAPALPPPNSTAGPGPTRLLSSTRACGVAQVAGGCSGLKAEAREGDHLPADGRNPRARPARETNSRFQGDPRSRRRWHEDIAAASRCGCHGHHCHQASSDCRISATGRRAPIRAGIAVSPATTSRVASTTASSCQAGGMGSACPLLTAASSPMASGMPRMAPGNAGSNCVADSPAVTCWGLAPSARDSA